MKTILRPLNVLLYVGYVSTLFFILLTSCSKSGDVSLTNHNFEDEIEQTQNLVFTFNRDLVPESELNTWVSTDFIEFSPKVNGKFKWTAPNELVFSPAVGFEPATEYSATITKQVLDRAKEKYGLDVDKLSFHTPYLKLQNTETYWAKSREDGQAVAMVKLDFNYPVNPQEVAKTLSIKDDDGKAYTYQIVQTGVSETVTAKVKDLANTEGKSLQITLEKGLSVPNSTYTTEEMLEASVALPDISTLEILNVEHGFDNNQGYIRVTFNQAIQGENVKDIYSVTSNASDTEVEEEEVVVELDTLGNPIPQAEKPAKKVAPSLETKAELIENGLLIKGDFNETDNYVLTINTKAKGVLGAALSDDYTKDIYFGDMPASVAFVNKKAVYLSSKGNRNVAVNIVNIPKVNVKISKIYENNILNFLRQNRYQDYGYEEGEEGISSAKVFDYYDDESGLYSDVIVNKTVEIGNLPKSKGISALNLSLPTQNDIKGIYLVTLNSADEYYKNATKLVSISDIGLITKQSDDEIIIFANSIKTAEPMGDVEISLISSNNQTIAKAKTARDGSVTFKDFKKKGFTVAMIVAHTEDDFNYLLYEDTAVETSRFEVDGKRNNSSGFEAFIYGDRDIYRPGEPIHFNTLIRKQDWESVGEIPVKIRILLPNGKEYKTFREQTNDQGAVAMTVPTDRASVTGTYVIEVLNGNDMLLASRNVAIEEFMPDRIKVDVKASKEFYRNGESVQIAATALNLFGPPASNRNYEMEFRLARKAFLPKGYANYTFDIQDNTTFESITRQGVTNQQGVAAESFQVPVTYSDMGVLEAKNYVTVFDETGRPVNRLKRSDIFTQAIFYGIGMPDTYIGTNAPTQIPLVALNKDGKPVGGKGKVEIVRFDYQTVIQRNPDKSLNYSSKKQTKVVYSRTVNFVNGQASVNYAPPISGEYEVRVHREGAKSWTAQSFYAYGWGNTENSSFEVNNEGQVTMEFDKEKYEVGDKAKVLFKTPFAGKLIVTIERNHVLEYHILETDKKSAELSFSLGKEHLPNVYISATLIRPMDESNLPLTVAHGYAPVMVEDTDNQLPIEIVAVERSRSKTKQHITIKTKANTELTIAVVDEGILQLKNFKTPDPYAYFYQKQALEVNSYDLYPFLFPEFSIRGSSSTGGDGYDLEKRVNPLTNSRVNLVAIWSGIVKTGLGGTTEFSFDIPQFSGDLRIMAVAYKDHAFGSATKNMKVADPLVISTALPRFASPNDEIQVPVNITNTTKQNASVTATITTTGSVGMVGVRQQKLVIPAEQEGRAYFAIKALPNTGNGSVTISVNGLKETFTERVELGVRAASSLIKTASSGAVNAGQMANVSIGLPDFIPSSVKSQLVVSKSPITQFIDKFDNLLGYPHGCVEQTVSKAFPQLYFKDFVALMQKGKKPYMKSGENELNPVANVNAAIHKLETMQLANGALAYWQGSDTESWWGTAYACHFMIEAQKADYEVNATNLGRLLEYLNNRANKRETSNDSYYDENNNRITRVIASREGIYGLYVLALAGKANRSVMNYYKSNEQLLTQDERYLLAAAYSLVGDGKSYTALLPKNYINTRYDRQTDYSFSSPIRDQALVLNTLIDSDPNNLQIPSLARQLSQALKIQPWLNTQEEAFAFLSLGKLAKKAASSSVTGSVSSAGIVTNFTGADLTLTKVGNPSIIRASGRGTLYYFAQSEGLSASGKVQELDNTLKVRRSYFSRAGQAIGTAKFKQNDLIVVKVTLSSSLPVHNIVVTDMLPAGFEIENPRLTADRDMTWIKDQTTPEHFDIRDDRINFFTSIDSGSKTFYYLVRAVSKGKYVRGPVSADAMYNGDYRSYSGSGVVIVD